MFPGWMVPHRSRRGEGVVSSRDGEDQRIFPDIFVLRNLGTDGPLLMVIELGVICVAMKLTN